MFFHFKIVETGTRPTWHLKAVSREVVQIYDGSFSMTRQTLKQKKIISMSCAHHSTCSNHSFVLNITWSPTLPCSSKRNLDLIKSSQLSNLHTSNSEPTHTEFLQMHILMSFNSSLSTWSVGKNKNSRNMVELVVFHV